MSKLPAIRFNWQGAGVLALGLTAIVAQPSWAVPPARPASPPPPQEETAVAFQTSQYAVRVYRLRGLWRMNVYDRHADKVTVRNMPVRVVPSDAGVTISNFEGETQYSVLIAPDGSQRQLMIQEGDRVIYSEQGS